MDMPCIGFIYLLTSVEERQMLRVCTAWKVLQPFSTCVLRNGSLVKLTEGSEEVLVEGFGFYRFCVAVRIVSV